MNSNLSGEINDFKEKIKQQWNEISDEDLGELKSIEEQICGLLESKYKFSKRKARLEVEEFLNLPRDCKKGSILHNNKMDAFKEKIREATDQLLNQATHEAEEIPKYLHKGEEKVIESIKEHPLHTVGAIAIAGFVLGTYLTNRLK